jgi:hypothetical protein
MPLDALPPLSRVAGVELISLQKKRSLSELESEGAPYVTDLSPVLDNGSDAFVDTAAVMCSLDLVVACDTAAAHLAGALGCRIWAALPWTPDWRWQRGREDTPWYPSMRLFRPTFPGDWEGVISAMAYELSVCAR